MSDVIEEFFKNQMSFKPIDKVVDDIHQGHMRVVKEAAGQAQKRVEELVKRIGSEICECEHPIVKKMINWGYLKGRTRYSRALKNAIQNLLLKDVKSLEHINELKEKMIEFKREMMRDIKEKAKGTKGDLRPLHMPGSVSHEEARNLYFGENYDSQALFRASTRLMNSTCIGSNIGVYFANRELREYLNDELLTKFGLQHIARENLRNLHIYSRIEGDKPYLVFMKFLLWLYKDYEAETIMPEKKFRRLLHLLRKTEGVIYFAPGREKAKYSTIPLPRLDLFFSNWLDVKERREALNRMKDAIYYFMRGVVRNAIKKGERRVAENNLGLLATYCDMFCAQLLISGFVSHEPLRRMIDLVLELSDRYNVPTNLSYAKKLISL